MATPDLFVLGCKIFQVLFALLGLPLNGYTLLLVLFGRPTVYSVLLFCMALSHLLFDILVAAFELAAIILFFRPLPVDINEGTATNDQLWQAVQQPWPLVLRRLQICLWVVLPVVNLWIICALVLDRYLVIMRPWTHDDKLSRGKMILLGSFLAVLLLTCSIPFWSSLFSCTLSTTSSTDFKIDSKWNHQSPFGILDLSGGDGNFAFSAAPLLLWTMYITSILVPSTVMLLCNSHLLFIILEHRNRILSTIYVVQLSTSNALSAAPVCEGKYASPRAVHNQIEHHPNQHKQRDLLLTTLHLFISLLLVLPYSASVSSQLLLNSFHLHLTAASMLVLSLTPLVNGYIYGLRSPPVKKAFHRVIQVSILCLFFFVIF